MAQCEKCGNTFTPSAERTEVTSLRILCSPCEDERRGEKAARAAAAAAAAQASARVSHPAAAAAKPATPAPVQTQMAQPASSTNAAKAPGPTNAARAAGVNSTDGAPRAGIRRPAATGPATPQRAVRPAPEPDAPAERAPARASRAASARPASAPRAPSKAKQVHGTPSKKLLHKPIAGGKGADAAADFHPDVQRELVMLKQRESKVMTFAWIACAVLLVAAGGFALYAKSNRDTRIRVAQEKVDKINAFTKAMEEFDVKTKEGAEKAIAFAEDQKTAVPWEEDTNAAQLVTNILGRARASLQKLASASDNLALLQVVKDGLSNVATKSAIDLRRLRRTAESLEIKGDEFGAEFAAEVAMSRKSIDKAMLAKREEEAKAHAAQANSGVDKMRAALAAYSEWEQEATDLLDRYLRKDEESKKYYTEQFQRMVEEVNTFVTAAFTPEWIEKVPWTDLLSEDQKKNWQQDSMKGFRIEGGTLQAAGPEAGTTKEGGLICVPAAGGYRDFVLEMQFTLKGTADFVLRLGKRLDNTVPSFTQTTQEADGLKADETYTLTASFIGSKLHYEFSPEGGEYDEELHWTKSRKGAVGAQVRPGTELKITKMRIRELR